MDRCSKADHGTSNTSNVKVVFKRRIISAAPSIDRQPELSLHRVHRSGNTNFSRQSATSLSPSGPHEISVPEADRDKTKDRTDVCGVVWCGVACVCF